MTIEWYGTAAVSIEYNGARLLFDPFVRMNKRLKPRITVNSFTHADAIFTTHGHFDHISSIPEIEKKAAIPVFGTETAVNTLVKQGVPPHRLKKVVPGDSINLGDFTITVYKTKHLVFDKKYIASVIPMCVAAFPKFFYLVFKALKYPDNNENIGFEISCEGKRVFVMGSFGTAQGESYPKNCDLLVLPLGGCLSIYKDIAPFIAETHPKKILITHYDNAFPPETRRSDAEGIKADILRDFPDTAVIIPQEFKDYTV